MLKAHNIEDDSRMNPEFADWIKQLDKEASLLPWWVWQGPSRSWPVAAGDPQGGGEWKEWQGQENCRTWEVNFAVML